MSSVLLALLTPSTTRAVDWKSLVMPGELIAGHAKYEKDCGKCHMLFDKSRQSELCRRCHKEVAADLSKGEGYHGRNPEILRKACARCHGDHDGRSADVVRLDEETFVHDLTDFPLVGAHLTAECSTCHKEDTKRRLAPSACVDCHRADSPHRKRIGDGCGDCHKQGSWPEMGFDHGTTKFTLDGRHVDVLCVGCHPGERYKATPKDCYSCHKVNDVHRGKVGRDCGSCHTTRDWDKVTFQHATKTDFPLKGKHAALPCRACHKRKPKKEKLKTTCFSCHEFDDEHRGHYGKKCETCHSASGWPKVRFDHSGDTDYPLRGAHRDVGCKPCHPGDLYKKRGKATCYSCHSADDIHEQQEGKSCERCHEESGWRTNVAFDHDLTRLPLLGLHAVATCEACHLKPRFKDADFMCSSCHAKDDAHKMRLGPDCGRCHNPNGWMFWAFDHGVMTNFALDGAHEGLKCEACHRYPTRKNPSLTGKCRSCHAVDDVHHGSYGRHCGRCHVTSSFKETPKGR